MRVSTWNLHQNSSCFASRVCFAVDEAFHNDEWLEKLWTHQKRLMGSRNFLMLLQFCPPQPKPQAFWFHHSRKKVISAVEMHQNESKVPDLRVQLPYDGESLLCGTTCSKTPVSMRYATIYTVYSSNSEMCSLFVRRQYLRIDGRVLEDFWDQI